MDEYNLSMLVVAFSLFLIFLGFLIWGIKDRSVQRHRRGKI